MGRGLQRFPDGCRAQGRPCRLNDIEQQVGGDIPAEATTRAWPATPCPGDRLLIDDGKVGLVVTTVQGDDVHCTVTEGGPVSNNKGICLPGMNVSVPALSGKDIDDLTFALTLGVDVIALSFVHSPTDADQVREIMDQTGVQRRPVIAKPRKA